MASIGAPVVDRTRWAQLVRGAWDVVVSTSPAGAASVRAHRRSPATARPMLTRLYEWGVVADVRGRPRKLPAGVTNRALQARALMLEALGAVPGGVPATA